MMLIGESSEKRIVGYSSLLWCQWEGNLEVRLRGINQLGKETFAFRSFTIESGRFCK